MAEITFPELENKFLKICDEIKEVFSDVAKEYKYESERKEGEFIFKFKILIKEEFNEKVKDNVRYWICFIHEYFRGFYDNSKRTYFEILIETKYRNKEIFKIGFYSINTYAIMVNDLRYKNLILSFIKEKKHDLLNNLLNYLKNEFYNSLENEMNEIDLEILCEEIDCYISDYRKGGRLIVLNKFDFDNKDDIIKQLLQDERFRKLAKELKEIVDEYKVLAKI